MESGLVGARRIPADLPDWRPQRFGSANARNVVDPIIEPLWEGLRVLVEVGFGDLPVRIIDEAGDQIGGVDEVVAGIAAAAGAASLVLDGYLTTQATRSTEGVMLEGPDAPSAADMTAQLFLGSAGQRKRRELVRHRQASAGGGPVAFVAVDLLLVDDDPLVDVPLLERKRILEGVLGESDLVRRTAYVRPPIDPWLGTWRSIGFRSLAYKAANSRYRPGQANDAWALARIPPR